MLQQLINHSSKQERFWKVKVIPSFDGKIFSYLTVLGIFQDQNRLISHFEIYESNIQVRDDLDGKSTI